MAKRAIKNPQTEATPNSASSHAAGLTTAAILTKRQAAEYLKRLRATSSVWLPAEKSALSNQPANSGESARVISTHSSNPAPRLEVQNEHAKGKWRIATWAPRSEPDACTRNRLASFTAATHLARRSFALGRLSLALADFKRDVLISRANLASAVARGLWRGRCMVGICAYSKNESSRGEPENS